MKAIHRLLMQVEAVHAVSWLWHNDVLPISDDAQMTRRLPMASGQLALMLEIIRQRAGKRQVVLLSLSRCVCGSENGSYPNCVQGGASNCVSGSLSG